MITVIDKSKDKIYNVCHEACENHFIKGSSRLDGYFDIDFRYCIKARERINNFPPVNVGGGNKTEPPCICN